MLQLREVGVPISDMDLLDASTLQNKDKILERLNQQSQSQQQMLDLQQQEIQSRIELQNARAAADKGLGLERVSRVQENQALAVERRAEAIKDQELGLLHLARAIKELEGMDIDQLEKIIRLSREQQGNTEPNSTPLESLAKTANM